MAKTQILDYYIHLRDRATAERLQAALEAGDSTPTPTGPGGLIYIPATGKFGIYRAPDGAAIEFGALDTPAGVLTLVNASGVPPTTGAGYISSPWFGTSDSFQTNVQTFTRSNGWWIFGGSTRFYWAGHVVYTPLAETDTPVPPVGEEASERATIPLRQRVIGFSAVGLGEFASDNGNEGSMSSRFSRESVRGGIEGFGMAFRANGVGTEQAVITAESNLFTAWSRGYIRPVRYPTASVEIFSVDMGGGSSGQGFSIDINASGQLALYNNGSTSDHVLVTTGEVVALDDVAKLDILTFVQQTLDVGTIKVYRRGVLIFEATRSLGGVLGNRVLQNHQWGRGLGTGGSDCYIDIADVVQADAPKDKDITVADWSNLTDYAINTFARRSSKNYRAVVASGPGNGGAVTPGTNSAVWIKLSDSLDWLHGSKNIVVRALSAGADHTGWTGDVRLLTQLGDHQTGNNLASTTSGAIIDVLTDAEIIVPRDGLLGLAALEVTAFGQQTVAGEADIGFRYAGGAPVIGAVNTGGGTLAWTSFRGNLSVTKDLAALGAIRLRYVKAANVNAASVRSLLGIVEAIGTFGPEDVVLSSSEVVEERLQPIPVGRTLHNCQWAQSPWARSDYALGPVVIVGGTYVGNGTAQDLAFPTPPAWLYIRPTTGGGGSVMVHVTDLQAHGLYRQGIGAEATSILNWRQNHAYVPASESADQQMEFLVTVGGTGAQWNQNAVTFQYIAFCDPAARFSRAGAVSVNTTLAVPFVHLLEDPGFLAEWAFFMREENSTSTVVGMFTKGPGHAAAEASLISTGTPAANAITFGTGQLSLGTGVVASFSQNSYLLFRRADGNNHPDQAKVMAIGTYTGDGNASRTIALPATGLRPLWAIVQSLGAVAIVRDPSHTTNTSQNVNSGSTTTTGITAGSVDGFTVGSSLNGNGVVYNYLVFFASATAGNGGWGVNGTYVPVPADSAFPSGWAEPTIVEEPEEEEDEPDPLDPGELTTDIAANCISASTRLVNIALSRIGVSKQLASLSADASEEAYQARMVYKTEIDATLRDFPWPFATRYLELTYVDGSEDDPVNGDWWCSYRVPANVIFVRRVVDPEASRRFAERAIPFRMHQDDTGDLVLVNEPGLVIPTGDAVEFEVTLRLDCPARMGDAIFRSAAAWRLAKALVAPLAKDIKLVDFCDKQYLRELKRAQTVHAREQEHQQLEGDADGAEWTRGR